MMKLYIQAYLFICGISLSANAQYKREAEVPSFFNQSFQISKLTSSTEQFVGRYICR